MKLLVFLSAIILAINAASDEELWVKFKEEHSKIYKSLREDKLRFDIFKSNLREIEQHNSKYEKGEESWFMAVNQFADLTNDEFKKIYLNTKPTENSQSLGLFERPLNLSVPESMDWRDKGAVLSVKNQGNCGSCWAFSAIAAIEGQNALKHSSKDDLSEQELVDCSKKYGNEGCEGGWMDQSFEYVRDHGISKATDYTYTGKTGTCKTTGNSAGVKLTGYKDIAVSENALKEAAGTVGPIAVAINADFIQLYGGGVFNNILCFGILNHGVLVAGYGSASGQDYWLVKNSWGQTWGEHGYIRMVRNRMNQCGIASKASYPILA